MCFPLYLIIFKCWVLKLVFSLQTCNYIHYQILFEGFILFLTPMYIHTSIQNKWIMRMFNFLHVWNYWIYHIVNWILLYHLRHYYHVYHKYHGICLFYFNYALTPYFWIALSRIICFFQVKPINPRRIWNTFYQLGFIIITIVTTISFGT